MTINKRIITISIIIILLILVIPTGYKVVKNHHYNLYQVVEKKIIDSAKKCYYEENCLNKKIMLKELYEQEYLEKVSDPVSKEYYNDSSYVEVKDNIFKFVVVE